MRNRQIAISIKQGYIRNLKLKRLSRGHKTNHKLKLKNRHQDTSHKNNPDLFTVDKIHAANRDN